MVRGLGDILAEEAPSRRHQLATEDVADAGLESFASSFARAYLTGGTTGAVALRALLSDAPSARGLPERGGGSKVRIADATIAGEQQVGPGRVLITVACEVAGASAPRYVVVPVARDSTGRLAVFGAPALVGRPPLGAVDLEEPLPLEGVEAPAIRTLAKRFMTGYLSPEPRSDLDYLLAPGARIGPSPSDLELVEITTVGQSAAGDGWRRTILVDARARDRATRSIYPLTYRLELVRRERWYVKSVAGEVR